MVAIFYYRGLILWNGLALSLQERERKREQETSVPREAGPEVSHDGTPAGAEPSALLGSVLPSA